MTESRLATILVRAAPGNPCRAIVQAGGLTFRAALGRSGRSWRKREGDGATPIASMRLIDGYFRRDRGGKVRSGLVLRPIGDAMLWCDAPTDANYNRPARAPFKPSHERLARLDNLYDICLVMDWNITSRARGRGSAIFFHLARPGYPPTEGCVAIHRRDMERLLPLVGPKTVVKVV